MSLKAEPVELVLNLASNLTMVEKSRRQQWRFKGRRALFRLQGWQVWLFCSPRQWALAEWVPNRRIVVWLCALEFSKDILEFVECLGTFGVFVWILSSTHWHFEGNKIEYDYLSSPTRARSCFYLLLAWISHAVDVVQLHLECNLCN